MLPSHEQANVVNKADSEDSKFSHCLTNFFPDPKVFLCAFIMCAPGFPAQGAEVIRMYQTLLGKDGFRKGMDLYFQRHDGHAVTCDDFLAAMADANGKDLASFAKWYSQAGTPVLTVSPCYSEADKTLTLKMKQVVPPTPGQPTKEPMLIPVSVGLLCPDGSDLPLKLQVGARIGAPCHLLH